MRQTADNEAVLRMIGSAGLRLALDDFGTGHSSLAPQADAGDSLKIDRSFVRDWPMTTSRRRSSWRSPLAETLAWTARRGHRDRGAVAVPAGLGCTLGQGYLLSRPVPADEVEELWFRERLDRAV